MDTIDSYTTEQQSKKEIKNNLFAESLIEFTSSNKYLIFVSVAWFLFVYTTFSLISLRTIDLSTYITVEGYESVQPSILIIIINILVASVGPISFLLIYLGSINKNTKQIFGGITAIVILLKVYKVIMVISALLAGIGSIIMLALSPFLGIFMVLFVGVIFALGFYIISIFTEFVLQLERCYKGKSSNVPLATKIMNFYSIVFVFGLIISLIFLFGVTNSDRFFPAELLETIDISLMIENMMSGIFLSIFVQLGVMLYYLLFIRSYDKHFRRVNLTHYNSTKQ